MSKNNGGPAFPVPMYQDPHGDYHGGDCGISARDYFAAHAPSEPWKHYKPTMPPKPSLGFAISEDGSRKYVTATAADSEEGDCWYWENAKEVAAWDEEYARQYQIQWPWFYADAMIAERAK